ncbi:MAG TPA: metallophosphoesterase [Candidatus Eremiobacteraceae bacterium]|nr:metallophosphoesterase [Candidatus Eremiobacteraceae bacterium]
MPYRILHIADVHLDMAFAGADAALGKRHREELRAAFERALALAKERRVDALCIAGDLYEDGRAGSDRAAYLRRVLGDLAPIRVFISPGNHDPHTPASMYERMGDIPDNVTIFGRRRFASATLDDGLTLWGFGHEHGIDRDPAIGDFTCEGPGTHLLLFHGSDRDHMPPDKDGVAPFSGAEIERTGAAYAMVGHFHGMLQAPRYAYPGSLEPHTVAQDGRHTASLVTVENGRVSPDFIDVNRVRYVDVDVDITRYGDRAELARAVEDRLASASAGDGAMYCRVRLGGAAQGSLELDAAALEADLAERFPGTRIVDGSAAIDLDAAAREGRTVRAHFVRTMRERIAAAPATERPLLEDALRYGMLAFARKSIPA